MAEDTLGIIGGTGLYQLDGLQDVEEIDLDTPFGKPSAPFIRGKLAGKTCVFLARHGRHHSILPHEINFRANIYGLKKLGVEMVLAFSAVGSMQEDIHPGDFVFPHQFFDRTRMRVSTFFGNGIAAHVGFSDPICVEFSDIVYTIALELNYSAHRGGTYLCMEGPQFSTRAESQIYRQWGVSVIGMTALQEAKLAREAEMCYATVALVTDYDCWHHSEEDVSVEAVLAVLRQNTEKAKELLKTVIPKLSTEGRTCQCSQALQNAIVTPLSEVPEEVKQKLDVILEKYL